MNSFIRTIQTLYNNKKQEYNKKTQSPCINFEIFYPVLYLKYILIALKGEMAEWLKALAC